jgi:protein involved in polysaccharide export with SLBB domain
MTDRRVVRAAAAALTLLLSACASREQTDSFTPAPTPSKQFPDIGYATWDDKEPAYRLYPGDVLAIEAPSAPELNRTVTVQADGRISLPLIAPQMVADRSIVDAEAILSAAYAGQLLRPQIFIDVKTPTPLKVFVGGEVDKPGVYDMPGDINALQAIIMAGGFKSSGKRSEVVIIRRGADGRAMLRTVNLVTGLTDPSQTTLVPLRRFDVVYVPRTGISEVGVFVQQYLRDTLPVQLGFSYAINGGGAVF